MIVPDINLLVYAYNTGAPEHRPAREWWENLMNRMVPVGIPWIVCHGFLRLMTHPRVLRHPMEVDRAVVCVQSWLEWSSVEVLQPGPRHLPILRSLLHEIGVGANLVTDASLAAIAIEHQCEIHSNDTDFSRFKGLRWSNPLQ